METDKPSLRSYYRNELNQLSLQAKKISSELITQKLLAQLQQNPTIKHVGLFAATSTEPYILPILSLAKQHGLSTQFYLPKIINQQEALMHFEQVNTEQELTRGAYKILEPTSGVQSSSLDLILVPGLAFTQKGERLGQGAGYYDKYLDKHPYSYTLGVGFNCQIADFLTVSSHDITLDEICLL